LTWEVAVEIAVERRNNPRLRYLCSEQYAHHLVWRRRVIEIATGDPQAVPVQSYPRIHQQAVSLWRSLRAFIASGGKLASRAERVRRLAICGACPFFNAPQRRCTKCGCFEPVKVYAAVAMCPDDPPRWGSS
jgi:hypothetical protein